MIKTGAGGQITRLGDVARVELAAGSYSLRSMLDNKDAVAMGIFQAPGSNALKVSSTVRETMDQLSKNFPQGIEYQVVYDPTTNVREGIAEVAKTLFEAILLVVIVVVLFLQTWRASIIPLVAVPVSIVGTFAVLLAFGFSINTLSLFGLVLAIGIVVDDAIVVVENVERNIAAGLSPREASYKAMEEVSRPIIAIALVLCAVFVPVAFVSGLTGQFYRQFALTIAFSTIISAVNSLTLSPALSAILLRPHGVAPDRMTRVLDFLFGWLFRRFNRLFGRASESYGRTAGRIIKRRGLVLLVYGGLLALTAFGFSRLPSGFVPTQDKRYLVAFAQLPDAATLDRTTEVVRKMAEIGLKQPGIAGAVQFPGLSINGFVNASNAGIIFFALTPFEERQTKELYGPAIAGALNRKFASIQDAFVAVFPPPPVMGLGTVGGFKMEIEDRAGLGEQELAKATQALVGRAYQTPELAGLFSSYRIDVPQLDVDVDREKAKQAGLSLSELFRTMQIYLGSQYVNDFNRFGRTYQVIAQADAPFRASAESIAQLKVRNDAGAMVPLGSMLQVKQSRGPDQQMHYNAYLSADINGGPAPGVSSGAGRRGHGAPGARDTAQRHRLRVDRPHLPAAAGGQHHRAGLPAVRAAGVPGAGGAVRELVAAGRGDPDRAHVAAVRGGRHLAHRRRQQRVHAGRVPGADRARLQERHPHRRVRPRARAPGTLADPGGARGGAHPPAAHPDDVVRLHHGRHPAGGLDRRRRRDPARHGHRGVRGHAGRDLLRPGADAGLLRARARRRLAGAGHATGGGTGGDRGRGGAAPGVSRRGRQNRSVAGQIRRDHDRARRAGRLAVVHGFDVVAVRVEHERCKVARVVAPLTRATVIATSSGQCGRVKADDLIARLGLEGEVDVRDGVAVGGRDA